ncbi:hypothetical protein [Chondromyces apiculatus]|uniref:Uncharacterized protein n=1 Tax=Chondromyces apiculatus DSM 436 TaxID=1192034 RepID=A0A017SVP2_9BACT|nr:hypothetical protein [Chondromyces apiculatus]EYF00847.1 Hypothetical protein CAP_8936 [Chondromyces apiculatus DSM 436]
MKRAKMPESLPPKDNALGAGEFEDPKRAADGEARGGDPSRDGAGVHPPECKAA